MQREIEDFIRTMKKAGKRVTPQRIAIFQSLISTDSHPTAQDIYHQVKQEFPTITLATVYKTLEMLDTIGLVKELGFSGLSTRYDANMKPHINLVCLKCGKIKDLNEQRPVENLQAVVLENSDFKITDQRIEFYGYCTECQDDK